MSDPNAEAICRDDCTSGCHASDCEHHGHPPAQPAIDVEASRPAPSDDEEAALAFAALNEAIRDAAMLRTESVTIQAPLARYLAAALSKP